MKFSYTLLCMTRITIFFFFPFSKLYLLLLLTNGEMQFIYASSQGGKGDTQLATYIGWTTNAKIRIPKTVNHGELYYTSAMTPAGNGMQ